MAKDTYHGLKDTIWPLPPHTRAKHEILRKYLEAYFAILGRGGFPRVAFIDGFAGPGIYKGGEPGSPIVALKAAMNNKARLTGTGLQFRFSEKDPARFASLQEQVSALGPLPENFDVKLFGKPFSDVVGGMLDALEAKRQSLPPALVMLDPFGWADMPMSLVCRLANHPKTEFLITLMTSEIQQHARDHVEESLDTFFGREGWRSANQRELLDLYRVALQQDAGLTFVRSFAMRDKHDAIDYFLVFGTRNTKGLFEMKRAMWSLDASGDFRFSDATNPDQLVLFGKEPDFEPLIAQLRDELAGRRISVEELEKYVDEETAFLHTHVRGAVLKPGEEGGWISVERDGARAGSFPRERTMIEFPG